jgi:hypothetical protein
MVGYTTIRSSRKSIKIWKNTNFDFLRVTISQSTVWQSDNDLALVLKELIITCYFPEQLNVSGRMVVGKPVRRDGMKKRWVLFITRFFDSPAFDYQRWSKHLGCSLKCYTSFGRQLAFHCLKARHMSVRSSRKSIKIWKNIGFDFLRITISQVASVTIRQSCIAGLQRVNHDMFFSGTMECLRSHGCRPGYQTPPDEKTIGSTCHTVIW